MNTQVQPVCEPPLTPEPLDINLETDPLSSFACTFNRHGGAFRAPSPAPQHNMALPADRCATHVSSGMASGTPVYRPVNNR